VIESAPCTKCGYKTDIEEYVCNFGWCDVCFDISYSQYLNETLFNRAGIAVFEPLLEPKPVGWVAKVMANEPV